MKLLTPLQKILTFYFPILLFASLQIFSQSDTPCECSSRWTKGGHWNADGSITESGNIPTPQGVIRCGNAADTQPNVSSCVDPEVAANTDCADRCLYNSNSFNIDLSGVVCFDPNNPEIDPNVNAPIDGADIIWLQFDTRAYVVSWEFQLVGGSQEYNWALFASTTPDIDADPSTGCEDLELRECGSEFSNTWSNITTNSVPIQTNYYMAVWNTGEDCTENLKINFKFRDACAVTPCIDGCDDPTACNYDINATCNDDSCEYGIEDCPDPCNVIYGCTNPTACNFDSAANCDDDSCSLPDGCDDPTACNYDINATCNDGSCEYGIEGCSDPCNVVYGCTNPTACNFDSAANCDDDSCSLPDGCDDPTACNYDINATCNDGSCEYGIEGCSDPCNVVYGCTNPTACNYDPAANCEDGSCLCSLSNCPNPCNIIYGCTDVNACNYDVTANCNNNSCQYGVTECSDPCNTILGCTDAAFANYNPTANCDDGSCSNNGDNDNGCGVQFDVIDSACGFNTGYLQFNSINTDQGHLFETFKASGELVFINYTLNFPTFDNLPAGDYVLTVKGLDGCTSEVPFTIGDGCICEFPDGCNDPNACNYDSTATCNDGSCEYGISGCTDSNAPNYNSEATCDDGSCLINCSCPNEYDPVCANGTTFTNACFAQLLGVNVYESGSCQTDTATFDIINNFCNEITTCTEALTPIVLCPEFCAFNESDVDPDYVITYIQSFYPACSITQLDDECFRYIPLPLMEDYDLSDSIKVIACNTDEICDTILYLMEVGGCNARLTGIDSELSNGKFDVYPNPNNGLLFVDVLTSITEVQTISVFDITGRELKSITIPASSLIDHIQVDLTDVAVGMYFVEWRTDTQNAIERIILE